MSEWLERFKVAAMPYQDWKPFPPEAIVQVRSAFWPDVPDAIGPAKHFWWGYEEEFGKASEGVIFRARRLDRATEEGK